jgi:hypothetical protein
MMLSPAGSQTAALPYATFYRLIDDARLPQRADRSAAGTLPTRASRYCDAVTAASSFGWWVFPPMDFSLLWDGEEIYWSWADAPEWQVLTAVQFPDFAGRFDEVAPAAIQGCSPPFLTVLPEPGLVQIWTGLVARTAPGWSLLIRPLANLPNKGGYALYEGIVETDQWFGPLFTNLRLTRTHQPVHFSAGFPLAQVQPLPHLVYADQTLESIEYVPQLEDFTDADWNDYNQTVVVPNSNPDRPHGNYAVAARRRRKSACPFAGAGHATADEGDDCAKPTSLV